MNSKFQNVYKIQFGNSTSYPLHLLAPYTLPAFFYDIGKDLMKHTSASILVGSRRFKSFFGVSPNICAICWKIIKGDLPTSFREVHLLWALFFLKSYNTESVNHAFADCDEKTFRTKVWTVIERLAFMKVVCLNITFL